MKEVTLTLKVITPLFMGGANMEPEIRSQSIKGIVRWWFRTLGGSFEEEKKLFGWGGEKAQKGGVKLIIINEGLQTEIYSKIFTNKGFPEQNGINYLSFSLDQRFKKEQTNKIQRKYIKEGETFKLRIIFSPLLSDNEIKKFLCALWCSVYLGNFGSRARRGFGSLALEEITSPDVNLDEIGLKFTSKGNDIVNWLKENINTIKSCFGKFDLSIYKLDEALLTTKNNLNSWVNEVQKNRTGKFLARSFNDISIKKENNALRILNLLGFTMMAFRSYLKPDYDNAKNIIQQNKNANKEIKRAIFGLPVNFFFSSIPRPNNKKGDGATLNLCIKENSEEKILRRASPLIFKVIENNDTSTGLIIFLGEKQFIPNIQNMKLKLKNVEIKKPNYSLIKEYLESLKGSKIIQEI